MNEALKKNEKYQKQNMKRHRMLCVCLDREMVMCHECFHRMLDFCRNDEEIEWKESETESEGHENEMGESTD